MKVTRTVLTRLVEKIVDKKLRISLTEEYAVKYGKFNRLDKSKPLHLVVVGDFALEADSYSTQSEIDNETDGWHSSVKLLYNGANYDEALKAYKDAEYKTIIQK